ncbi:hypothetical protein KsCSTR_11720 [Candidatus Kuenenia stuttgartiensis]|uniref:Uncharacterized protein n=1 Tax=Kuenenia stuttgartiensis TaxID=174633 RepID=Q1PYD7_KUEST|nr:hypothetical protein [Planctomycetia bacterium]QII10551.1 hypothetical protein KsCSTR_11720 [Candidatus Kuenenia stuttgartiensis]CAJ72093.1 unknown protein [Candidatus Kuenenia stuttgartiensis]
MVKFLDGTHEISAYRIGDASLLVTLRFSFFENVKLLVPEPELGNEQFFHRTKVLRML